MLRFFATDGLPGRIPMDDRLTQSVSFAHRSYSNRLQLHEHAFHQIVLPRNGAMELEVDGRGGRVDWSQGVFVPAGARHVFATETGNEFAVLDVGRARFAELFGADSGGALGEKFFFPIGPEIRHLLDYAACNETALRGAARLADSWTILLLQSLASPPKAAATRGQLVLARALAYIEGNFSRPVSVGEIARAAGISERRLYILFRQELKCTPFAYVAGVRMNRAVDLLRETTLSIPEIAFRTGYADQSSLTHALKKAKGTTPASHRRRMQGR